MVLGQAGMAEKKKVPRFSSGEDFATKIRMHERELQFLPRRLTRNRLTARSSTPLGEVGRMKKSTTRLAATATEALQVRKAGYVLS